MIFENGYPRVSGSTDFEDSSHLAGILAITEHPQAVDCRKYVYRGNPLGAEWFKYIRCPNSQYDFSRDQFILLAAGLIKQEHGDLVNLDYVTGRDIMPPSVRGMVRIAQGKEPTFIQSLWFLIELWFHCTFQKLEEPFQIMALCMTYDRQFQLSEANKYLRLWTTKNPLWRWSIRRYLCALDGEWRGEKELGEHIIKYVESKL